MIIDVWGCGSCPFLDEDVMLHDARGICTLEERIRPRPTIGKGRHRLAAVGSPHLVPLGRTPSWCPMRTQSIIVALRKR